tara:strand:- start:2859 stop:3509 length:651 start_codon:yes stop_codon:yes gene_type:complete
MTEASVDEFPKTPEIKTETKLLSMSKMFIGVEMAVCFIIICSLAFAIPHPSKSSFPAYMVFIIALTIILLTQIIGVIYFMEFKFLENTRPATLILPIISIVTYFMTLSMGYAQTSSCDEPKRSVIYIQSFIPVIVIVGVYFCVTKMPWMQQGFYDLISSGKKSEGGMWLAVAFWMACASIPSVLWTYFTIQQESCNNNTEINIKPIDENSSKKPII